MTEKTLKEVKETVYRDMSDDEIAYEMSILLEARDHFIEDIPGTMESGDLVVDRKNGEIGFVGGAVNTMYGGIPENDDPLMLVVTRVKNDSEDARRSILRTRYTKSSHLKRIKLLDIPSNNTLVKSIKKHCKEECILSCGEECSLYKFLNKKEEGS